MKNNRFGQFLIENHIVSEGDVLEALNIQRKDHFPLGQLAIAEHLLTERQVLQILNAQRDTPKRFRDLAVELGLLSEEEVVALLAIQEDQNRPIGTILVQMGRLTPERRNQLLNQFHRIHSSPVRGGQVEITGDSDNNCDTCSLDVDR